MTSASAIALAAAIALTALLAPAFGATPPSPAAAPDPACAAETSATTNVWTTCSSGGDYHAANLSLSGHALIAGPLAADAARVRTADVAEALHARDVVATGDVAASRLVADDLRVDGAAYVSTVQLPVLDKAPACVEGTIAIVRAATGADALEACLAGARSAAAWVPVATGAN